MKLINKFAILIALLTITTLSYAQKGGNTGACMPSCPNYPCCLDPNIDCDDTPCNKTNTGGGGGTSTGYDGTDRPVIWLHGMEGSSSSWQRYYNDYVQKYKIFNVKPSYISANGAHPAATSVADQVNKVLSPKVQKDPTKFIIAHSMGGLVSRKIDMNDPSLFGGLVTVGTCHAGAKIAEEAAPGKGVDKFLQEGITNLSKGPIAQVIPFPSFAGNISSSAANFLSPKARAEFEKFGKPAALETLSPNGSVIALLNAQPVNSKPKIAFAGAEDDPTLWREVQSLGINFPSDLPPDVEKDQFIPDVIEGLKWKYMDKYNENRDLAMNTWLITKKNKYTNRANAWVDGYIWLDQSNGKWQALLGAASGSTMHSVEVLDVVKYGICDNRVEPKRKNYVVILNSPNDGVVLESSALALPGANYTESLPGVNHQQCMNHINVTTALTEKVFKGGGNAFFKCTPR